MDEFLFGSINYSPEQMQSIKEMERRANDTVRVFNPTNDDFHTGWDSVRFTIPNRTKDAGWGKGQRVVPRYIAINYLDHMTTLIIGQRYILASKAENERRRASGQLPMTKYEEEKNFQDSLQLNTRIEKMKIWKILWLGVEEEWGFNADELPTAELVSEEERAFRMEMERKAQPLDDNALPTLDFTVPTAVNNAQPVVPQQPAASFTTTGIPQQPVAPVNPNPVISPLQDPIQQATPQVDPLEVVRQSVAQ